MKMKIIFFSLSLFLITGATFAQKKDTPKSIISEKVGIKKYHDKEELDRMQKGQLLELYIERIKLLVKTLPYIAFATKPGVTMSTLGIPNTKDNRETLNDEFEASDAFLETTLNFQRTMLPYSDKSNLIAAIIFYEDTMKSLHQYSEFH
ncbi:hypothetical protein Q4Q34_16185 [Flavivirga abyssicola]|uniref:hypothetical protein n=1 Tax=Flavivirga abyssicola TaxID=3063533 RepID=UPI0026E0BC9A|nr:hypothetical protein [Flavivirga sp. MEBiC07777]WVK12756.1 hypothetical protein Q4Q34_16185 [Flavivirga sp. MEBiC07777]